MVLENVVGNILVPLLIALAGIISYVIFYPQNRKKKEIENTNLLIESWKELASKKQSECDLKQLTIEKQSDIIRELTKEKFEMQKAYSNLEIEKIKDSLRYCKVAKCLNRDPQTGY